MSARAGAGPRRVAVMQPYFFPYAGYFRLLALADCFVILDCVQFNRRGRVHRTEVPGPAGPPVWLTLPLARQPRDVLVRDLEFAAGARSSLDERLARFPWLATDSVGGGREVLDHLRGPLPGVVDFLDRGLGIVAGLLGLSPGVVRSSGLGLPSHLRGQERIIEIVRAVGGDEYVNSPGGRHLYSGEAFRRAGLRLSFLEPYEGPYRFLLPALLAGDPGAIRADVLGSLSTVEA